MSAYRYEGTELDLFANANNWKGYWRSQLRSFVRGDVLEVGAGSGSNTRFLSDISRTRWVCLEPDAVLCDRLRGVCRADDRFEVVTGGLADAPTGARFDTILYLDVLEHIQDDVAELRQAASRLRPSGNLIVLAPAHQWLFSPFDQSVGHVRRYNKRSLRAAAPPELSPIILRYLDAAGIVASLGNRIVLRQGVPTERQLLSWDRYLVPFSRHLDRALGYQLGKSILGVWRHATDS